MRKKVQKLLLRCLKNFGIGVVGAAVTLLVVGIFLLNKKPDLSVWHSASLDEEFSEKSGISTFSEYRELEDRLFQQLGKEVYDKIDPDEKDPINRYHRGSLSDPESKEKNWNRSFEFAIDPTAGGPKIGVLLIHGLSDSPYSLRGLGETLHSEGAHVIALRVPGHGTAPSGLTRTRWQDMAAAVEIAVEHLEETVPDRPLFIVGYSNGGALAVHYALRSLADETLPSLSGIALISPEIGITRAAALAVWQERIGKVLGLKKLQWTEILPEYDPYKYGSFPVNAGNLAYRLTRENRKRLARLAEENQLDEFPPVIAFQSVVDATVQAPALVEDLFFQLPDNDHEIVVFGLNRTAGFEVLYVKDPQDHVAELLAGRERNFSVTVLASKSQNDESVVIRTWGVGETKAVETDTPFRWPPELYSLSHVALPFSENDPVYGNTGKIGDGTFSLGNLALRGEKGVLKISANDLMRLRWNPFYPYLESRVVDRFGLSGP